MDRSHLTNITPIEGVVGSVNVEFASWEKYSEVFGSKIMKKMGCSGGGLGKEGNGIINPILISKEQRRGTIDILTSQKKPPKENRRKDKSRVENKIKPRPAKTTLITGRSILNGIEEHRLRKYKAKVRGFLELVSMISTIT